MTAASATSKGTILVVDDNRLVLATLDATAWRRPATTSSTPTTATTRSCSRARTGPQLALLDIRMEGKSGFDVAAVPARPSAGCRSCSSRPSPTSETVAQVEGARRRRLPGQAARHQADRAGGRGSVRAHRGGGRRRRRGTRPRAASAAGCRLERHARRPLRDGGRRPDAPLFADAVTKRPSGCCGWPLAD